jgi:hypothetical protein
VIEYVLVLTPPPPPPPDAPGSNSPVTGFVIPIPFYAPSASNAINITGRSHSQ